MTITEAGKVSIGTSGIMVPGKKQDYPEAFRNGSRLHYYSSIFKTIEINSTFHKLPLASTLSKWTHEVADDFRFTLKLWKEITHSKKLQFKKENIDRFMEIADAIGHKKGCLLVQFPGSITSDYADHVEEILDIISKGNKDQGWAVAVEFRNPSWYHEVTWEMLQRQNAILVYHDLAASRPPLHSYLDKIVYLRFHGPTGNYRDSYSNNFLEEQEIRIRNWIKQSRKVYAYFNNTVGGALENAMYLQKLSEN